VQGDPIDVPAKRFIDFRKMLQMEGKMLLRLSLLMAVASLYSASTSAETATAYPALGHAYLFEFGTLAFRNEYSLDGKELTFTRLRDGYTGTVHYTTVAIRPNLFWTYWVEADGTSVSRVEDFERGLAFATVHFHEGKVINLSGTLRRLD
jgi:MoaF-like